MRLFARSFEARCPDFVADTLCLAIFMYGGVTAYGKKQNRNSCDYCIWRVVDAADVFVSLISQKSSKTNTKEYLAKKKDIKYNEDEVQKSQIPSGSCGLMAMMNEMEYRTMGSALAGGYDVQRSIADCQRTMTCKAKVPVVANQRDMLEKYCEKQGWEVGAAYQDDGFTGLNMETS